MLTLLKVQDDLIEEGQEWGVLFDWEGHAVRELWTPHVPYLKQDYNLFKNCLAMFSIGYFTLQGYPGYLSIWSWITTVATDFFVRLLKLSSPLLVIRFSG